MQQAAYTNKFLRQRKSLLVLPVLIIPFITMAFWALGGGKETGVRAGQSKSVTGLNLQLPNASLKDDNAMDKMAYYEIAKSDSAKLEDLIKNDPNLQKQLQQTQQDGSTHSGDNQVMHGQKYVDANEEKVYQKIDQLNAVLNQQQPLRSPVSAIASLTDREEERLLQQSSDQIKMKQLMNQMNSDANSGQDTEMKQLDGMLEKILDIQHPERVKERYEQKLPQRKEQIYATTKEHTATNISLLDTNTSELQKETNQFLTVEKQARNDDNQNAIEAVVHETQTLVNGAVIKLRLLNDIYINGHRLHKDNFIYGTAMLSNERLSVSIRSIRDERSVYLVKMEVYDMDGLAGIYIPGAITRDVAKQSTDNALQSVALNSLDPSLGAQAASAGIETARQLISKKVKLVKVQVKAGYKILLKDMN